MKLLEVEKNKTFRFKNGIHEFRKEINQEDSKGYILITRLESNEYWLYPGDREVELLPNFKFGDKVKVN